MFERFAGIDAYDLGLGAVGAQKHRVQLAGQIAVRCVTALAGNQS